MYVNSTIETPVYVYYFLEGFYQNHREYARSRSYSQLRGSANETVYFMINNDRLIYYILYTISIPIHLLTYTLYPIGRHRIKMRRNVP